LKVEGGAARLPSMALRPFASLPTLSGGAGFFGHASEVQGNRLAFIQKATREVERVSRMRVPRVPTVIVNHPDLVHELMVERAREFEKSHLLRYSLYRLAGEGLFTALFEPWKRQRRIMAPAFHPGSLDVFAASMVECTAQVTRQWRGKGTIDLAHETTRITMGIAGKTLFNADALSDSDEIGQALTVALDWTAKNAPNARAFAHLWFRFMVDRAGDAFGAKEGSFLRNARDALNGPVLLIDREGRELRRAVQVLDTYVEKLVRDRKAEANKPPDLLTRILEAKDEDGTGLDAKQVRDEILTLFVAGHETTATGLAWCIYLLCKNPDEYAKVEAEVDALAGEPTLADLPRLKRCQLAFKEALRIYPPVYLFSRQAKCETELDGTVIPRGTATVLSPLALHMREDLWPDPLRFDPERFLPEREAARSRYAWLPFGAGPRVCIGAQFALMEAQLVLAHLLRSYRFASIGESEALPSATLRPRGGMPMRITERVRVE
jgi:cytochrome P450